MSKLFRVGFRCFNNGSGLVRVRPETPVNSATLSRVWPEGRVRKLSLPSLPPLDIRSFAAAVSCGSKALRMATISEGAKSLRAHHYARDLGGSAFCLGPPDRLPTGSRPHMAIKRSLKQRQFKSGWGRIADNLPQSVGIRLESGRNL